MLRRRSPLPPFLQPNKTNKKQQQRQLARHLQLPRRSVRLASRRECIEVFGFAPGTLPPVGHGPHTALVVDFRLGNACCCAAASSPPSPPDEIVFGCGDDGLELALSYPQLLRLIGRDAAAVVGDVADVAPAPAAATAAAATAPPMLPPPTSAPPPLLRPLAEAPKFLVDSMCGRLARWLRCLGLDAESLEVATERLLSEAAEGPDASSSSSASLLLAAARAASNAAAESAAPAPSSYPHPQPARKTSPSVELVAAQRRRDLRLLVAGHHARREGRVLLTRDAQLATSREGLSLGAFLLASDETVAQLAELAAHFGRGLLEPAVSGDERALLTRCSSCNRAEYEPLSREEARDLVPPRAWAAVDEFWRCGPCGRVVWWGPKSDRAVADTRARAAQALAMLDARLRLRQKTQRWDNGGRLSKF